MVKYVSLKVKEAITRKLKKSITKANKIIDKNNGAVTEALIDALVREHDITHDAYGNALTSASKEKERVEAEHDRTQDYACLPGGQEMEIKIRKGMPGFTAEEEVERKDKQIETLLTKLESIEYEVRISKQNVEELENNLDEMLTIIMEARNGG